MAVDGFEQLDALARDLAQAAVKVGPAIEPVLSKGALNVKKQLQKEAGQSRHFRIARHISYDIIRDAAGLEAEIGPEKTGAGNLANIAYFGGARGGGGSLPDPQGALDEEQPRFVKALERLVTDL